MYFKIEGKVRSTCTRSSICSTFPLQSETQQVDVTSRVSVIPPILESGSSICPRKNNIRRASVELAA